MSSGIRYKVVSTRFSIRSIKDIAAVMKIVPIFSVMNLVIVIVVVVLLLLLFVVVLLLLLLLLKDCPV